MRKKYFEPQSPVSRKCDFPGCENQGEYRAPKDRNLKEYYWFCLDHVREYNKNWDFYADMSEKEIEDHIKHDTVWQRPTWNMDPKKRNEAHLNFKDHTSLFGNFEHVFSGKDNTTLNKFLPEEEEALNIMGLGHDLTLESLKKRYKKLVKQCHPDIVGDNKQAEERFKKICDAYNLLKDRLRK